MADDCISDSLLAVFVEDFSQVDTRRRGTIARHKVAKLLELHMQRSPSDEEITTALGRLPQFADVPEETNLIGGQAASLVAQSLNSHRGSGL